MRRVVVVAVALTVCGVGLVPVSASGVTTQASAGQQQTQTFRGGVSTTGFSGSQFITRTLEPSADIEPIA